MLFLVYAQIVSNSMDVQNKKIICHCPNLHARWIKFASLMPIKTSMLEILNTCSQMLFKYIHIYITHESTVCMDYLSLFQLGRSYQSNEL